MLVGQYRRTFLPFRIALNAGLQDLDAVIRRGVIDEYVFHLLQRLFKKRDSTSLDEVTDLEDGYYD